MTGRMLGCFNIISVKCKRDFFAGQAKRVKDISHSIIFSRIGFKKFFSGRDIKKKIRYFDKSAGIRDGFFYRVQHAARYLNHSGGVVCLLTCSHRKPGNRGNTWNGFPPKPQGFYFFNIFNIRYLAGGMTNQAGLCIFGVHAETVIPDPDKAFAAVPDRDRNVFGPCIQRVLYEFFYYRCRAFNHLAGCNLVGNQL